MIFRAVGQPLSIRSSPTLNAEARSHAAEGRAGRGHCGCWVAVGDIDHQGPKGIGRYKTWLTHVFIKNKQPVSG